MAADITLYTRLITSEHALRAKFMATVAALVQPVAETIATTKGLPAGFDLDDAIGAQLDRTGEWIGRSRVIETEITDVYFAFDDEDVGFDFGTWFGPESDLTGLTVLPDDAYRTLLRAKVAANQWDGTIPQIVEAFEILFGASPIIVVFDNGDMSMDLALVGPIDAVTKALFAGRYLDFKPAGVRINYYYIPTAPGAPLFGFDVQNDSMSGFDTGAWAVAL